MKSIKNIDNLKLIVDGYFSSPFKEIMLKRVDNLFDIIIYNNQKPKLKFKGLEDYLDYYEIDEEYKLLIKEGKLPFSKDLVFGGYQGTSLYEEKGLIREVIYFPNEMDNHYNYDCILIHEFLHICDIFQKDDNKDMISTGLEVLDMNSWKPRKYETLNEILHQRISEDVLEYAMNNNLLMYNTVEEASTCLNEYRKDRCLVIETFYNKYKDVIVQAKVLGDINILSEIIGVENLENFNRWINEYFNKYPTPEERKKLNQAPSDEYINFQNDGMEILNSMQSLKY